ncbi:hypothetical protein TgHK011_000788 [Trichoderma gracile]|nr:hypothetical protein TgHK011_000788 [Trichoderma gracile]
MRYRRCFKIGIFWRLSGQRSTCYPTRPIGRAAPLVGRGEKGRKDLVASLSSSWCLVLDPLQQGSAWRGLVMVFPKRRIRGEEGGQDKPLGNSGFLGGSAWVPSQMYWPYGAAACRLEARHQHSRHRGPLLQDVVVASLLLLHQGSLTMEPSTLASFSRRTSSRAIPGGQLDPIFSVPCLAEGSPPPV